LLFFGVIKIAMKIFLHLTLMMAIITAGISPACAFINGQTSMMELCSPDGDVRLVEVPAAMDPFADNAPTPADDHHAQDNMDDCTFCFAKTQSKSLKAADAVISPLMLPRYLTVSAGMFIPASLKAANFHARAPPVFS
jgi:hypothetical protein